MPGKLGYADRYIALVYVLIFPRGSEITKKTLHQATPPPAKLCEKEKKNEREREKLGCLESLVIGKAPTSKESKPSFLS